MSNQINSPAGWDYTIYSDEEWAAMQAEEDESAAMVAAWRFNDEVEYRQALAFSYPQDAMAQNARVWLERFA